LMNCQFLVSHRVASVLSEYNIQNHRLFPARVEEGANSWGYFLFFLFPDFDSLTDFSKSIFYTGNELSGKTFHTFASAADRLQFSKNTFGLKIQELHLKAEAHELDLFALDGAEIAISERLKVELLTRGLDSGIKILPAFGNVSWAVVEGE
jgi:hypothetical protein